MAGATFGLLRHSVGHPVKRFIAALFVAVAWTVAARSAEEAPIRWLVEYDGTALPAGAWTAQGAPEAEVRGEALHLADSTAERFGFYRAEWKAELGTEIVVEATVRV